MKIGIITLQLQTNYGGVLQAFALQRVLENLGNDLEIIQLNEIIPEPKGLCLVRKILTRSFRRYVLHRRDVEIFRERRINREFPIVGVEFVRFFRKYMKIRYIPSFGCITPGDYTAFVVGSDQVWRPKYNRNLMNSYLDFTWKDRGECIASKSEECRANSSEYTKPQGWDVKRVSYAVSFGSAEWEYDAKETAVAARLAGRFDALSFRELSGAINAEKHLGVDSSIVLDPTLLLSAEDYLSVLAPDYPQPAVSDEVGKTLHGNDCVFEYILDRTSETLALVDEIEYCFSKEQDLDRRLEIRRFLAADPRGTEDISKRVQPSVESWLEGISAASLVVTDSFHACVFSILFHRPFIVLGNHRRGLSRILWLLEQFGLLDRLVVLGSSGEISQDLLNWSTIDWDRIDRRLEELRSESLDFIKKNLN